MIIVSQDRQTAYNFTHIYDISLRNCSIVATVGYRESGQEMNTTLARYDSLSSAIAVFDELLSALSEQKKLYFMPED